MEFYGTQIFRIEEIGDRRIEIEVENENAIKLLGRIESSLPSLLASEAAFIKSPDLIKNPHFSGTTVVFDEGDDIHLEFSREGFVGVRVRFRTCANSELTFDRDEDYYSVRKTIKFPKKKKGVKEK